MFPLVKILESTISRKDIVQSLSFDLDTQSSSIVKTLVGIRNLSFDVEFSSIRMAQSYSDYTLCGRLVGQKVIASRWPTRLNRDLKRASLKRPEYLFEAIDILFEDKAAN
ncbi:hypothetical protein HI914_06833 [Erysiphe necator]|nr:hypothetical protein HI914_06833 [Erysiphe necator]